MVFNLTEMLMTIADSGQFVEPGVSFGDSSGNPTDTIYFYQLKVGDKFSQTKKLLLLR